MFGKSRLALALVLALTAPAFAADAPGVTATEVKVGGIFPFSGPASSIGLVGRGILAYVQSVNDRGGINGRKISYIAYDDAYSPPKAVEHARKLVESDEVAFMFSQLGTPGNTAVAKYLISKGVPAIAIVSGSNKFTNVVDFPLTTTSLVSFDTEGKIYAKFLTRTLPNAKYAILYQNDDLGKDYVNAFRTLLKGEFDKKVAAAAYEINDPTVDSQVGSVAGGGDTQVCSAGNTQGLRNRLEADDPAELPVELGWRDAEARGPRQIDRGHRRNHHHGPD